MNDPQTRIARAGSNAAAAARGGSPGRAGKTARPTSQPQAPSPAQTPLTLCITITERPRDPFYFKPVFYTLSGKCRVGMREGACIAEICIAPHTWAVIHGSAGALDFAMRAAIACDPYVKD